MQPLGRSLTVVAALIALGCGDDTQPGMTHVNPANPDVIPAENARPGDAGWLLTNPAGNHEVEGYGSKITMHPGDGMDVMVSVDKPKHVAWKVYRSGWYDGTGGRLVDAGATIAAMQQAPCPRDPVTSRVECHWTPSFHVAVPADAVSGVYLVVLTADDTFQSYVPYVVVDGRQADIVMNVNVTTWEAYNGFGGESLYQDDSGTMPSGKAWEASFDRPFVENFGAGRFLGWEVYMVQFAEALGYDVTYTTGIDITHDAGAQIDAAKTFLSVGNDEYWTLAERVAVQGARDRGVNLAFLGADQALWRIRLAPSTGGTADRVVVCYKSNQDKDPVVASQGPMFSTANFRSPPAAMPENGMIGVMYNGWLLTPQPFVVADGSAWIYAGTNLRTGDALAMLVSFETDGRFANGAEPAGLQVLGNSPLVDADEIPHPATATYYKASSGAEVVGIGSMGWPMGLGHPIYADARAALITRNILDRFVMSGRKGAADPTGAPWGKVASGGSIAPSWARAVATVAGTPGDGNPMDGPGTSARFLGPAGLAVAPDGTIFVADAPAHQIRRIGTDAAHTVSTYAGDGTDGYIDGPAATARFRYPTGLALAPDGTLYVADADNHVIRAIAPDASHTVSTYAGVATRTGGFVEGPVGSAQFDRPVALAFDKTGALLVADMHNSRIRRIAGGQVTTFAGSIIGYQDGPAASAELNNPSALVVAGDGTVFVLDTFNRAIRRIAPDETHTVTTLVGGDGVPGCVDGPAAMARIGGQGGLALLGGKLYFTDVATDRIRVVTPGLDASSSSLATFAGNGRAALEDGAGNAAAFAAPIALAVTPDGALVVADSGNHAVRRIQP